MESIDLGADPTVVDIEGESIANDNYRTVRWTGKHLQVTLMSITDDIGVEVHHDTDQFLKVEQGKGIVQMGKTRDKMTFVADIQEGDAIMVPSGTWHNITSTGIIPLKLYSIYGPPHHPHGTVHTTKMDAQA